jgi:hypothetical protein
VVNAGGGAGKGGAPKKTKKTKGKATRKGMWTPEEEAHARELIRAFQAGLLDIKDGLSLRSFLNEKLKCNPMRVSKKFFLGKQFFSPSIRPMSGCTAVEIEANLKQMATGLVTLEERFLSSAREQQKAAAKPPAECSSSKRQKRPKAATVKPKKEKRELSNFDDVASSCFEILNNITTASCYSSERMNSANTTRTRAPSLTFTCACPNSVLCQWASAINAPVHAFVRPWPKIGTETRIQSNNCLCFECGLIL